MSFQQYALRNVFTVKYARLHHRRVNVLDQAAAPVPMVCLSVRLFVYFLFKYYRGKYKIHCVPKKRSHFYFPNKWVKC